MPSVQKRHSAAAARNREPILEVLRRVLPDDAEVLEIASGTGEHAVFFAEKLPSIRWQPSDRDEESLDSIEAWRRDAGLPNVLPPLRLDVLAEPWPVRGADAIFCANMIHIAPWEATLALFRGASGVLPGGGLLILYGPFREGEKHSAESNRSFDESLRARNPAWGVRDRFEVERVAQREGFVPQELVRMPANNLILIFVKDENHGSLS